MRERGIPYVVAITGASGAIYGVRLVEALAELGHEMSLCISESAKTVIQEELEIDLGDLKNPNLDRLFKSVIASSERAKQSQFSDCFVDLQSPRNDKLHVSDILKHITYYHHGDFTAPIASGSYPTKGMMVVPCSTTTLARIAAGISQTLIERAAECTIKEGRKLVLVPRETPLSAIHLENMLKLARLGVAMVPAMPAFYSGQKAIDEMIDFVVGKAMDSLQIPHALFRRWVGSPQNSSCHSRESGNPRSPLKACGDDKSL